MKISPSRPLLSSKASIIGFLVSALLHAGTFGLFVKLQLQEIKPPGDEKMIKISLNSFNPAPVQAPSAPVEQPAPPTPPAPPPPEPEVVKPPEPKPIEKPKSVEKPKPKKPAQKPVEKPIEKPKQEPVITPEPVVAPQTDTVAESKSTQTNSSSTSDTTSQMPAGGSQAVGEFNFASASTGGGDARFAKIQQAIKKHHRYPKRAQKMKHQGIVEVSFLFKTNGTVENVKVLKSSGFESLDEAAVETIKRAFKEFPTLERDYMIKIPIAYRLI